MKQSIKANLATLYADNEFCQHEAEIERLESLLKGPSIKGSVYNSYYHIAAIILDDTEENIDSFLDAESIASSMSGFNLTHTRLNRKQETLNKANRLRMLKKMPIYQTTTAVLVLDLINHSSCIKRTCKEAFEEAQSLIYHAQMFNVDYQATAADITDDMDIATRCRSYQMTWTYPISYTKESLEERLMRHVLHIGGDCFINLCHFEVTCTKNKRVG